jgi:hypothetical protein
VTTGLQAMPPCSPLRAATGRHWVAAWKTRGNSGSMENIVAVGNGSFVLVIFRAILVIQSAEPLHTASKQVVATCYVVQRAAHIYFVRRCGWLKNAEQFHHQ